MVSRTLITKYESGAIFPTEENLKRLADYFAVSPSELMPDEERISALVKATIKPVWLSLTVIALIISFAIVLLLVLPIFDYGHFVYSEEGQTADFVYGNVSLLSAYFRLKNPLAIITFVLSLLNSGYTVFLLFAGNSKYEKTFRIAEAVVFAVIVCLFIATLICGIKIIGSDDFQMNRLK